MAELVIGDESFACADSCSGWWHFTLIKAEAGSGAEYAIAVVDFLREQMTAEEFARCDKHLRSANVSAGDISRAVTQLFLGYTGRPTRRPADSTDGPSTTPATSTGGSSSRPRVVSLSRPGGARRAS